VPAAWEGIGQLEDQPEIRRRRPCGTPAKRTTRIPHGIETVIGRFREARLGRRRMTVGQEAASGLAAMLAGRQITMRDGISA
jgi:hypothetical protein